MGNSHTRGAEPNGRAQITSFYSEQSWIEGRAEDQLGDVAGWPGMKAVSAFPDLHPGRHGPVGAAFLADRLYPQLVGPDIGCGMSLFRLSIPRRKLRIDKACRRLQILDDPMSEDEVSNFFEAQGIEDSISSLSSLGTIGGGNHFCELQEVTSADVSLNPARLAKGDLCLLVHTGSRGHGCGIFRSLDETWNNGFSPTSPHGREYLRQHDAAVKWASINRQAVAHRAAIALRATATLVVDSVHNSLSEIDGAWLHRKGAAAPSQGLAPLAGSRDDHSYLMAVTAGPEALWSLSHGAGRKYDRGSMHGRIKKVKSEIDAQRRNKFGGQVLCNNRDLLIEEAGVAYKSADNVATDLEAFGLARRIAELTPVITFKTTQENNRK
jgi:release factor H-coupled RctB family protein